MILIAHRGNIDGINTSKENHPDYIKSALDSGFYAEIDLWWIINKRARMKRSEHGALINNEITFYCDEINPYLKGVLNSMDIKVEIVPTTTGTDKYLNYYRDLKNILAKKTKA